MTFSDYRLIMRSTLNVKCPGNLNADHTDFRHTFPVIDLDCHSNVDINSSRKTWTSLEDIFMTDEPLTLNLITIDILQMLSRDVILISPFSLEIKQPLS